MRESQVTPMPPQEEEEEPEEMMKPIVPRAWMQTSDPHGERKATKTNKVMNVSLYKSALNNIP